ncbi:MAG: PQQ-like beta-propeller repeat protein [Verrucomicrobia bacterium]|nr:PQQ-like beta-propeller repeat protein [Verrucomicrobiota bacterium]
MKIFFHQIALAVAIACGAFLLAAGGLLVFNQTRGKVAGLVTSRERMTLIEQLHKQPKDEALKQRIRVLDLQLRRQTFTQLRLSGNGARAMLGALVVFLASAHFVRVMHRGIPNPVAWGARSADEGKQTIRVARYAVSVLFGLLAAGALFLGTQPVQLPVRAPAVAAAPETPMTLAEWEQNWPAFRGPWGDGATKTPLKLNVLWKVPVALPGMSSPVIWGNALFLSGADEKEERVFRFDADTGKLLWSSPVKITTPRPPTPRLYEDTGMASPTPVTDGRRVYAIFANGDVAAFDFEGKQVWARNIGPLENAYGYASSLALWENQLLIQLDLGNDDEGKSKMLALDTRTGQVTWQKSRPTGGSWASPVVFMIEGKPQLVTFGDPWILTYNPVSGEELWRVNGLSSDLAPSPILAGGLIIACKVHADVLAIRPNGSGDVTKTHVAWTTTDGAPDVPSPVAIGNRLYLLGGGGLLRCCELTTGKELWAHDFGEEFYSSVALAGNTLVMITRKGVLFAVEDGEKYKEAKKLELGEACNSSPAFRGARMYIRAKDNLFCFGE